MTGDPALDWARMSVILEAASPDSQGSNTSRSRVPRPLVI